jgi:hypothetical protein
MAEQSLSSDREPALTLTAPAQRAPPDIPRARQRLWSGITFVRLAVLIAACRPRRAPSWADMPAQTRSQRPLQASSSGLRLPCPGWLVRLQLPPDLTTGVLQPMPALRSLQQLLQDVEFGVEPEVSPVVTSFLA